MDGMDRNRKRNCPIGKSAGVKVAQQCGNVVSKFQSSRFPDRTVSFFCFCPFRPLGWSGDCDIDDIHSGRSVSTSKLMLGQNGLFQSKWPFVAITQVFLFQQSDVMEGVPCIRSDKWQKTSHSFQKVRVDLAEESFLSSRTDRIAACYLFLSLKKSFSTASSRHHTSFCHPTMMMRQQQQFEAKLVDIEDEDCSTEDDIDRTLWRHGWDPRWRGSTVRDNPWWVVLATECSSNG